MVSRLPPSLKKHYDWGIAANSVVGQRFGNIATPSLIRALFPYNAPPVVIDVKDWQDERVLAWLQP